MSLIGVTQSNGRIGNFGQNQSKKMSVKTHNNFFARSLAYLFGSGTFKVKIRTDGAEKTHRINNRSAFKLIKAESNADLSYKDFRKWDTDQKIQTLQNVFVKKAPHQSPVAGRPPDDLPPVLPNLEKDLSTSKSISRDLPPYPDQVPADVENQGPPTDLPPTFIPAPDDLPPPFLAESPAKNLPPTPIQMGMQAELQKKLNERGQVN